MKNITMISILLVLVGFVSANETRIGTLQSIYYVDDVALVDNIISLMPGYSNRLYGDLARGIADGGLLLSRRPQLGTCGLLVGKDVTLGYGRTVKNLDVAVGFVPSGTHWMGKVGIGRSSFSRRIDLAANIKVAQEADDDLLEFIVRLAGKKGDYTIVPAYSLSMSKGATADPEYMLHRVGLSVQRSLLEEGMVYLIGHYDKHTGDLDEGAITAVAGVEMRLGHVLGFRCGLRQTVDDKLDEYEPVVFTPGVRATVGDFDFDFFVNRSWPFEDDENLLVGAGVDFKFDRY